MAAIKEMARDTNGNMVCAKCGKSAIEGKIVDYDCYGEYHLYFVRECPCGTRNRYYTNNTMGTLRYTKEEFLTSHIVAFLPFLA